MAVLRRGRHLRGAAYIAPAAQPMVRFPNRIETDRLVLRLPTRADARKFYKAVIDSQAELRVWMPWAVELYDLDKAKAFCEGAARELEAGHDFTALMVPKRRGRIVGCCSLKARDWSVPRFRDRLLATHRPGRQRLRDRSHPRHDGGGVPVAGRGTRPRFGSTTSMRAASRSRNGSASNGKRRSRPMSAAPTAS